MDINLHYLLEPVAIFAFFGIIYAILVTNASRRKKTGFYSVPDWNFELKKQWAIHILNKWKRYRLEKKKTALKTEEPQNLINDKYCKTDTQIFWGGSSNGSSIFIRFIKKVHRTAEVTLAITMPDGSTYQLPNYPDTVVYNDSSHTWSAGGLSLSVLEPFKRWRIIFNGLMTNASKNGEVQHIKLNLLWLGASDPLKTPEDNSSTLMAEALALEPWKNENWMHGITKPLTKGYDQYGSFAGIINLGEDPSHTVLHLCGSRQRRWGSELSSVLRRSISILGMAADGTVYQISVDSYKRGLTQVKSGNIRKPNGRVSVIDIADIDISMIGENDDTVPKAFSIKILAESKEYTLTVHLNEKSKQIYRGGRPWDWELQTISFQAGINGSQGIGLLQLWKQYNGASPLLEPLNIKHLNWSKLCDISTDIICANFSDSESCCPELVGAKGASLALLFSISTNEFKVPNGFCLTIRALESQLKYFDKLERAIKDIEDVNINYNEENLKKACKRATDLFCDTPVCDVVREQVKLYLLHLNKLEGNDSTKDLYFAVRSSGIGEDSEELSAAGQNATILGCKSTEDVLCGIQQCWSSLFAFQSVQYRRQYGQPVKCGMGVVVQVIVEANAAGVMFTRHPNTGNPANILITSNFGLGESVVSGQVEPDTIILNKSLSGNVTIKSIEIGKKTHKIVLKKSQDTNDNGTECMELNNNDSSLMSITEEQCLKLGNIAVSQEAMWGAPRDIEWAVVQGIIYLLQARPITSLNCWTEFELHHELDTPIMSEEDLLTFANTGEVLPNCFTPLSYSTVAKGLDDSIVSISNEKICQAQFLALASTHYRIALNVQNTIVKKVNKKLSTANRIMDVALFGHIVTDSKMHSIAAHRNGIDGSFAKMKWTLFMLSFIWKCKSTTEAAVKLAKNFNVDLSDCQSASEMYDIINEMLPIIVKSASPHNGASNASIMTQMVFLSILIEGKSDFTTENYVDIGTVLSSCPDVISAEVPKGLKEIAKIIQSSNNAESFCKEKPEGAIKWLEENCPDAKTKFVEFLQKHGHRSMNEFDLITDTWGIDSTELINSLKATLKTPIKTDDIDNTLNSEESIVSRLISPMKNSTRKILKYVIPLCQRAVARREMTKYSLILTVHKFRLAYKQLALQMMKEWRLPDVKLIYYMTHSELGRYLQTRNPEYIIKAMQRKRHFPSWNSLQFPELNWGIPQSINTADHKISYGGKGAKVIGTPVCPGEIVGRACVVHSLSEIGELQQGDILITNSTDIGWSPYFPLLGGVVTQLGGLVSHGAVVAREYGLPCIVGAQGATNTFKTGDTVLLAASKGILQKLEDTSP